MKYITFFIGILVSILCVFICNAQQNDFPVLKGPYLGQKPPGMTPEVFAPNILNTLKMGAFCSVFSPDGNEFYFVYYERENETIGGMAWMKRVNNVWSRPEMLHFNSSVTDNDMCMSSDGKKLIFRSWRALLDGNKPKDHSYLWFVERTEDGWSHAKPLYCGNVPVRTGYPSLATNGTLYFAYRNVEVFGIYRSKLTNGAYGTPEHVFTAVDSTDTEGDMFVAPDESYLIISCWDHPDNIGSGQGDLYITFKKDDGTWTEDINMGELINTQYGENCPQVSPDDKYFFFNRYNPDAKEGNIYWVDAGIIEELRPMDDFPVLKGPYLGQKPPGMTPELFAPEIIATNAGEGCSGWGNDMEYFIFQRWFDRKSKLFIMNQNDGIWSAPDLLPFVDKYQVGDFTIAPDGKTLVFASNIFLDEIGSEGEGGNIWVVEKTDTGWNEPKHIGLQINTKYHDSYPCLTANGNLYFFSRRPGGYGDSDLYMSEFIEEEYQAPANLGPKLNSKYHEWDTYIAPDESYMIYCSTMPDGLGEDDLYVTFKTSRGLWSNPVHMGDEINTNKSENRPYVSPDGKYFFYTSTVRGNRDIYWVDAKIIEDLKPKKRIRDFWWR